MNNNVILVVEDNPNDAGLILHALKKNNIASQVVMARDGREALDYLFGEGVYAGRESSLPEMIFLDLKMPGVDGLGVLRRIRADGRTKDIQVVIFTVSKEEEDVINGYKLGANSYVCKPVDGEEFIEVVRQLGTGLHMLVQNEPQPMQ